jgi:microcystin-dependent protein
MDPYLGQILTTGFYFAPKGWALCNGQLLAIAQNQALFSLLGTTYGGDGRSTFALPNLQGRVPPGVNSSFPIGSVGGTESVTLQSTQMPAHTHTLSVSSAAGGTLTTPQANTVGGQASAAYASSSDGVMATNALSSVGSTSPHENRAPFLVMNYIIALQGIFPSQN